jgi:predicted RNase H-like HicB family nuclease
LKKDIYEFPAIFTIESDGISIEFPDLEGCLTCAHSLEEAHENAKEAMALHLFGMEEDNEEIPEPTNIKNIKLEQDETLVIVRVNLCLFREKINNDTAAAGLS